MKHSLKCSLFCYCWFSTHANMAVRFKPWKAEEYVKTLLFPPLPSVPEGTVLLAWSQTWPACCSDKNSIQSQASMQQWWYDTVRGKRKYSKKNLPHCHFTHHMSYINGPGIEPGPVR